MATKWTLYGSAGVAGLGLIAAGAVVTANAIELHSRDGQSVPGGAIVGTGGGVLDGSPVTLIEKGDGSFTVASPSNTGTVPSASEAPVAPVAPPPPAPADDDPASPPSAASAPFAVSAGS